MSFQDADRRYVELKQQYDVGTLSVEEFDARLRELMVQDAEGRWWAKSRDTGDWNYHDGSTWIRANPPQMPPPQMPPPQTNPLQANSPQANPPQANPPQANSPQANSPQANPPQVNPYYPGSWGNTSGMGDAAQIPSEIKGWNWGAFLLNVVWAFFNGLPLLGGLYVLLNLFLLIPLVNFFAILALIAYPFVLGAKGNEWAWRRKRWRSIEDFHSIQKKWTRAGVIVYISGFVLIFVVFIFAMLASRS